MSMIENAQQESITSWSATGIKISENCRNMLFSTLACKKNLKKKINNRLKMLLSTLQGACEQVRNLLRVKKIVHYCRVLASLLSDCCISEDVKLMGDAVENDDMDGNDDTVGDDGGFNDSGISLQPQLITGF